jgi:hypothetical protein
MDKTLLMKFMTKAANMKLLKWIILKVTKRIETKKVFVTEILVEIYISHKNKVSRDETKLFLRPDEKVKIKISEVRKISIFLRKQT